MITFRDIVEIARAAGPLRGECAECGNEGQLWHWLCEQCEQQQQQESGEHGDEPETV